MFSAAIWLFAFSIGDFNASTKQYRYINTKNQSVTKIPFIILLLLCVKTLPFFWIIIIKKALKTHSVDEAHLLEFLALKQQFIKLLILSKDPIYPPPPSPIPT